jgi:hypothetical protein
MTAGTEAFALRLVADFCAAFSFGIPVFSIAPCAVPASIGGALLVQHTGWMMIGFCTSYPAN